MALGIHEKEILRFAQNNIVGDHLGMGPKKKKQESRH